MLLWVRVRLQALALVRNGKRFNITNINIGIKPDSK